MAPRTLSRPILHPELVRATFVARENRFVVSCAAAGGLLRAHLPNSGRLGELLLPGVAVWLEAKVATTLPFKLVAVERDGEPVMVESVASNDVAAELLERGLIRLRSAPRIDALRREVTYGSSRFDLELVGRGRKTLVEVKSCTQFSARFGMFPDAATERGKRHVEELTALAEEGVQTAIVVLVQSARPRWFLPDYHVDPEFAAALHRARDRVEIAPFGVGWSLDGAPAVRPLEVPWELYEAEAGNHGVYLVHLTLDEPAKIDVGALGRLDLAAGHYVYVGSAKQNLSQRLARHRRQKKKHHWHIDHLRAHARFAGAYPIVTRADLEHDLAAAASKLACRAVPGFGCSDCDCDSHLFAFEASPVASRGFWDLVQHFRMERLGGLFPSAAPP